MMSFDHSGQRAASLICVVVFFLYATIAGAADAQQDVTTEATDNPPIANPEATDGANTETGEQLQDLPSEAEQRELGATEDPMATDKVRQDIKREEEPSETEQRRSGFDIYGSLRVRYRKQENLNEWQDGGSRIGTHIEWRVLPESFLYVRYEAGFNLLTGLEGLANPGDKAGDHFSDTVFTRLFYTGLDTPVVNYVLGKNWSTYYKVSFFTDRFMGTGGSASGTYNAQTDGGPTGTGRADNTLQRISPLIFCQSAGSNLLR